MSTISWITLEYVVADWKMKRWKLASISQFGWKAGFQVVRICMAAEVSKRGCAMSSLSLWIDYRSPPTCCSIHQAASPLTGHSSKRKVEANSNGPRDLFQIRWKVNLGLENLLISSYATYITYFRHPPSPSFSMLNSSLLREEMSIDLIIQNLYE